MPEPSTVLVFMAAALALNLTPGPDMLYVTARSVSDGRAAGVLSAFGIATGTLVHIAALALGLARAARDERRPRGTIVQRAHGRASVGAMVGACMRHHGAGAARRSEEPGCVRQHRPVAAAIALDVADQEVEQQQAGALRVQSLGARHSRRTFLLKS